MRYHTMAWMRGHYNELDDYEKGLVDESYDMERKEKLERKHFGE